MSKAWSTVKGRLIAASYAAGWWLVCRVPESWGRWVFHQAGDIAWRRQGHGVEVLEANLRRVIGPEATGKELRALSRAAMSSYARYWFEVFRLPVISSERLLTGMGFVPGEAEVHAALAAGRGVVLALPHMGNWDQAGAWIIATGVPRFTTVAERLEPESLARRFFAFREGLGFEVLPATGEVSRFGTLARRLRDGGLVCLPADRDVTGSGIKVEFFGEQALMMGGSAALAVQTGAALMPVTLWFKDQGWGAHIHEEIPVPVEGSRREKVLAMTQQLARDLRGRHSGPPAGLAHAPAGVRRRPGPGPARQGGGAGSLRGHGRERRSRRGQRRGRERRRLRGTGRWPGGARRPAGWERAVRIGMVCPYTWEVPGGVQEHVKDLTEALIGLGHEVSVISPADDDTPLPPYVTPAGRAIPVPYNGSVARLAFGFVSAARVRRWVKEGGFDVLHVHEPPPPACPCWPAGSRTGPSWRPCTRPMRAREPCTPPTCPCRPLWRRSVAGSRCPRRPAPPWWSTWAATRC